MRKKRFLEVLHEEGSFSFVRYAVAACVIGIVAVGAFMLLNQKAGKGPVAIKTVLPQKILLLL
jgi:hypothetical protein